MWLTVGFPRARGIPHSISNSSACIVYSAVYSFYIAVVGSFKICVLLDHHLNIIPQIKSGYSETTSLQWLTSLKLNRTTQRLASYSVPVKHGERWQNRFWYETFTEYACSHRLAARDGSCCWDKSETAQFPEVSKFDLDINSLLYDITFPS